MGECVQLAGVATRSDARTREREERRGGDGGDGQDEMRRESYDLIDRRRK